MKKKLLSLLVLPLLASCSGSTTYKPRYAYPGPEPKEFDMTVNFFLDYSHSTEWQIDPETGKVIDVETPIYTMRWYMLEPLGTCPTEALLDNSKAPDSNYPIFLGYSEVPTCLDEDQIWKFESDYKQSNVLNLYGIWVSNS